MCGCVRVREGWDSGASPESEEEKREDGVQLRVPQQEVNQNDQCSGHDVEVGAVANAIDHAAQQR